MHNPGDVIADCPSCSKEHGVQFREYNDGVPEAACVGCGEIFSLEDDDAPPPPSDVVAHTAATPASTVATPAPAPPPAAPPPAKKPDDIGSLKPVSDTGDPKSHLQLKSDGVDDFTNGGSDIPNYIRNSRAWRWAHKMGNTGNPYREGSRNNEIFQLYVRDLGRTVEECVAACAEKGYNEKLSYLLTVYEVTAHCLSSGLLVMDPKGRVITQCQGKPVPIKVT